MSMLIVNIIDDWQLISEVWTVNRVLTANKPAFLIVFFYYQSDSVTTRLDQYGDFPPHVLRFDNRLQNYQTLRRLLCSTENRVSTLYSFFHCPDSTDLRSWYISWQISKIHWIIKVFSRWTGSIKSVKPLKKWNRLFRPKTIHSMCASSPNCQKRRLPTNISWELMKPVVDLSLVKTKYHNNNSNVE